MTSLSAAVSAGLERPARSFSSRPIHGQKMSPQISGTTTDLASSASASQLAMLIASREVSPVELFEATIANIERRNADLNAFVHLGFEEGLARAHEIESAVMRGATTLGPLAGVPVAMKDLYDYKVGWPSTLGGVPALRANIATFNSMWVNRMEAAGAIIVGKTNAAVFGFRGTGDNPLFGSSKNPFDTSYNSGGSSGGAAAAVAGGLVSIGQATDGGGSIRIPAAFCGLVGLKPTFGRIPMPIRPNAYGATSPFLHDGVVTRTIEDTLLALEILEGYDSSDPYSSRGPKVGRTGMTGEVKGLRVAYSSNMDDYPIEAEVDAALVVVRDQLASAGAIVDEVRFGFTESHYNLNELWCRTVVVSQLEGMEALKAGGIDILGDHPEQLSELHHKWLNVALGMTTRERSRDQLIRTMVFEKVQAVLDRYDVIITPTTACVGIKNNLGGDTIGPAEVNGISIERLIGFGLTSHFNFTGHPALSVPMGMTASGLPLGMQVIANRFDDASAVNVGRFIEQTMPWSSTYSKTLPKV